MVWSDNQEAIKLAKNPVFHARTKHIGVHFNVTKDLVANKEIKIEYVPTEDMIADIFTKALDQEKHTKFSSMMGLLPLLMIEPRVRGCVEQRASANVCILLTQSSQDMSQKADVIRSSKLNIDNRRLPKLQAMEHAKHAQISLSQQTKQNDKRKAAKQKKCSSQDLAQLIDANARQIATNVRAAFGVNSHKRRMQFAEHAGTKRQRVRLGKYQVRKGKCSGKATLLKCFDRQGGPSGRVHTHQWWMLVLIVQGHQPKFFSISSHYLIIITYYN
jgi:hypothetical protein